MQRISEEGFLKYRCEDHVESDSIEFIEPALLIRISRLYRPTMSALELYEATRGVWVLGPRREQVRLAMAVFEGEVKEIYELDHWQPAGTAQYSSRSRADVERAGRWEFVGAVANSDVRERYLGMRVERYFTRGAQNPVTYVGFP
jgi:hypothetical protein